jgi:hypothetical protein
MPTRPALAAADENAHAVLPTRTQRRRLDPTLEPGGVATPDIHWDLRPLRLIYDI